MDSTVWWLQPSALPCGDWPFTLPGTGGALRWLASHDLRPGQRLGLLGSNSPAICSLIQAAGLAGLDLVLLNRRLLPHELEAQLTIMPCTALAVGADGQPPAMLPLLTLPNRFDDEPLPPLHSDRDVALVVFTSGTSGPAKPVRLPLPRLRLASEAARLQLGLQREDRWLACLPLDHIGGASLALRAAWTGCQLRLHRRFSDNLVDAELDHCAITGISLVPTMLHRLISRRAGRPWPAALRCLLIGGAALSPELANACAELGLAACATYGLSEAASMACAQRPSDAIRPAGRVGSPLPGLEIQILNPDADGAGIIALRGAHLTPGYEREWLHTGDLGRQHADGLEVLGRRDDVIVSGGEKIAPDQVEAVLLGHPAIAEAVVTGIADPEWGHVVVAVLVARGHPPDEATLATWMAGRLAEHRRPRRWLWLAELPRTSLGKPRRGLIGTLFARGKIP